MEKFLRSLILRAFVMMLGLSNYALAQVFDFSEMPQIRVYISAAPGMGHQSASVVVMRRLRQLGFGGDFDVVYADSIANKLPSLLPGFNAQERGRQRLDSSKVSTISESHFFAQTNIEHVRLAVTGADDNRQHIDPEKIKADRYLLMEPLGWGDSFVFEGNNKVQTLTSLRSLGYYFETDASAEGLRHALESMEREGQSERAAGLKEILARQAHFGAIYGVGTIPQVATKLKNWVQALERAAQSAKLKNPIILPIISPLNKFEQLTLQDSLTDILVPEGRRGRVRLSLKDLADPDLQSYVESLKAGDILLVNVGRVPQTIFERLFSISDLPVLVAGKNAMNLAQNLGKVYLNTVNDSSLPSPDNFKQGRELSMKAHNIFVKAASSDRDLRLMVQFLKDGMNSDSDLSKMHQSFQLTGRDKVSEALRLIKIPELGGSCRAVFL